MQQEWQAWNKLVSKNEKGLTLSLWAEPRSKTCGQTRGQNQSFTKVCVLYIAFIIHTPPPMSYQFQPPSSRQRPGPLISSGGYYGWVGTLGSTCSQSIDLDTWPSSTPGIYWMGWCKMRINTMTDYQLDPWLCRTHQWHNSIFVSAINFAHLLIWLLCFPKHHAVVDPGLAGLVQIMWHP